MSTKNVIVRKGGRERKQRRREGGRARCCICKCVRVRVLEKRESGRKKENHAVNACVCVYKDN
jgi:hypothetical protein